MITLLPDLPTLKDELFKVQMDFVQYVRDQHLGVLSECAIHQVHEGNSQSVMRATGDGESTDFDHIETAIEIKWNDDIDAVFDKLFDMGVEIATKMQINSLATIDKTLSRMGRTIDGKGKPWAEQYLEMLSNVMLPLNDDGELDLSGLRVVAGPEIHAQATQAFRQLEADPAEKKRYLDRLNVILAKKKEEAIALEANRKLVG